MVFAKFSTIVLQDKIVNEIAEKLGKTPTQVLLRWGLQHGSSVLPKSVNPDHLKVQNQLQNCVMELPGLWAHVCCLSYCHTSGSCLHTRLGGG